MLSNRNMYGSTILNLDLVAYILTASKYLIFFFERIETVTLLLRKLGLNVNFNCSLPYIPSPEVHVAACDDAQICKGDQTALF